MPARKIALNHLRNSMLADHVIIELEREAGGITRWSVL
jgi:hypothetical protein